MFYDFYFSDHILIVAQSFNIFSLITQTNFAVSQYFLVDFQNCYGPIGPAVLTFIARETSKVDYNIFYIILYHIYYIKIIV